MLSCPRSVLDALRRSKALESYGKAEEARNRTIGELFKRMDGIAKMLSRR